MQLDIEDTQLLDGDALIEALMNTKEHMMAIGFQSKDSVALKAYAQASAFDAVIKMILEGAFDYQYDFDKAKVN